MHFFHFHFLFQIEIPLSKQSRVCCVCLVPLKLCWFSLPLIYKYYEDPLCLLQLEIFIYISMCVIRKGETNFSCIQRFTVWLSRSKEKMSYSCYAGGVTLIICKTFCIIYEPEHNKTNKMTCAPSEDSDQPRHPPSLISLCCPTEEGWVLSCP